MDARKRSVKEPQRVTVDAPSHSPSPVRLQGALHHGCRNPHAAETAHRTVFLWTAGQRGGYEAIPRGQRDRKAGHGARCTGEGL